MPIEQFNLYKALLKQFEEKKIIKTRPPEEVSKSTSPQKLGTRTSYVPPWYKGERGAYESSMRARAEISKLPKMKP